MEANLLRYLIQHEGKPVSRKTMLEEVWGLHEDTDTRAIDNFIVRLRRYIEDDPTAAPPADRSRRRLSLRGRSRRRREDARMTPLFDALAGAKVYDLAQPYFVGMPHHPAHPPFLYSLVKQHGEYVGPIGNSSASDAIALGSHVGTHIDALCHFSCGGRLYGDADAAAPVLHRRTRAAPHRRRPADPPPRRPAGRRRLPSRSRTTTPSRRTSWPPRNAPRSAPATSS